MKSLGTPDKPVLKLGSEITSRRVSGGMSETDALKKRCRAR